MFTFEDSEIEDDGLLEDEEIEQSDLGCSCGFCFDCREYDLLDEVEIVDDDDGLTGVACD